MDAHVKALSLADLSNFATVIGRRYSSSRDALEKVRVTASKWLSSLLADKLNRSLLPACVASIDHQVAAGKKLLESEARKTTAGAISCGSPMRPIGENVSQTSYQSFLT
jgi:hypothetical protein